jgi:hypothetical protein
VLLASLTVKAAETLPLRSSRIKPTPKPALPGFLQSMFYSEECVYLQVSGCMHVCL